MDQTMHAKALARADRIDRTFFRRNANRLTYVREPIPFEGLTFPKGPNKRWAVVGRRDGRIVRYGCTMAAEPPKTEAIAFSLFMFCVDTQSKADPESPSRTVRLTHENSRDYNIMAETITLISDRAIGAMINAGEITAGDVADIVADKYDKRRLADGGPA